MEKYEKKILKCIVIGLILSFNSNIFSFRFFEINKQSRTEKILSQVKKIASNELVKKFMVSLSIASAIYIYQLIAFSLAEDNFHDANPEFKKMLDTMAKKNGIRNPENIKLKLATTREKTKSTMRTCLELLFLVPLFEDNLKNTAGCTEPAGNIYISPAMLINRNRARFILGHELSHIKHKDTLVSFLSNTGP